MSNIDIILAVLVAIDIPIMVFLGFIEAIHGGTMVAPARTGKIIDKNMQWFFGAIPLAICVIVSFKIWVSFSLPLFAFLISAAGIVIFGWVVNMVFWAFTAIFIRMWLKIPP